MLISVSAELGSVHTCNVGIPFKRGEFFTNRRHLDLGVPYKAARLLSWPDGSVRVLRVQFSVAGSTVLSGTLEDGPQELTDQFDPITTTEYKGYPSPTAIAAVDPKYLSESGIVPPFNAEYSSLFDSYHDELFKNLSKGLDYETSGIAHWIFDRASANLMMALRSGNTAHYREAYAAFQFWNDHLQTTDFCYGGFDLDNVATPYPYPGLGCKNSCIYVQPILLFAALFGEINPKVAAGDIADTQWSKANRTVQGCQVPYTDIDAFFTERHAGFILQAQVSAWELTDEFEYLLRCVQVVENLYQMVKNNPDGEGDHGYCSHSWGQHEYFGPGPLKGSEDRVFSPWMQCVIADPLWQLYNLSQSNALKERIGELLRGFGNAIVQYGVDASRMEPDTRQAIESAYGVKLFDYDHKRYSRYNQNLKSPYVRYVANHLMAQPTMTREYDIVMNEGSGWYADQHIPEALFQISLAYKFETDPQKRNAIKLLARDMSDYFRPKEFTAGTNIMPRAYNWQLKCNPWGTYQQLINEEPAMPAWLPTSQADLWELDKEFATPDPIPGYGWLNPPMDYTGSGQLDIILYEHDPSNIVDENWPTAWLWENAQEPAQPLNSSQWPFDVRHPLWVDRNSDGILDGEGGVETTVTGDVFLGDGAGTYTHDPAIEPYAQPLYDHDDFTIVTPWPADLPDPIYWNSVKPNTVFWADIDGDGVNERVILLHGWTQPQHRTFIFKHDGADWQDITTQFNFPSESLLIPVDYRQTGHPDLICGLTGAIYDNDGNGNFYLSGNRLFDVGRNAPFTGDGSITIADLTNNGYPDVIFHADHGTEHGMFINEGNGAFRDISSYNYGYNGRKVYFGNFHNDGTLGMLVYKDQYDYPANTVRLYKNKTQNPGVFMDTGIDGFGPKVEYIKDGQTVYREQVIQYKGGGRGIVITPDRHIGGVDLVDSINITPTTNPPLQGEPPAPPQNQPPTVSIATPPAGPYADTDGLPGEDVTLTVNASDPDGTIASVEWRVNGVVVGNTASLTLRLDDGQQDISVTVTDDDGATATDARQIVIQAPAVVEPDLIDRDEVLPLVDQLRADIENL